MGMKAAQLYEQEYHAILKACSDFGFSDTDDVPLSAIVRSAFLTLRDDPLRRQGEDEVEAAFKADYHCQWIKDDLRYIFDPAMSPGDPDGAFAAWKLAYANRRPLPDPPKEGQ